MAGSVSSSWRHSRPWFSAVSARLTVVSHSSTAETVTTRFPDDAPLDDRGAGLATDARGSVTRADRVFCSPAPACRQTAAALGLTATLDPLLREWDLGRWRGRTLAEVAAAEPDGIGLWLSEPAMAPHGGEPLSDVLARAAHWLAGVPVDGHTVAVTHPALVRGILVSALGAPPDSFWRIDIAPLTATVLRGGGGRWTLRSSGNRMVPRAKPATCSVP